MYFANNNSAALFPDAMLVVACDHGFGNMKTPHTCFKSGVLASDHPPVVNHDVLVYDKRYYVIGENQKEFTAMKGSDQDYYILTLAAIAEEMKLLSLTEARVWLAVGLPLTWVGQQKEMFRTYMLQRDHVDFTYRDEEYHVDIVGCDVYPQGFAAVAGILSEFHGTNMLCDIGNGTMNIMYINDGKPIISKCYTEKYGVNQCMLKVRENLLHTFGTAVDDSVIERVLRTGTADIGAQYLSVIRDSATEYVDGIFRKLREHEYSEELMKLYIVGGGGCLVSNFGTYDANRVTINTDISATAKGYEMLAKRSLRKKEVLLYGEG